MEREMDSAASACHEAGVAPEGKALDIPVHLHSEPHLWSGALGSDRKNEFAYKGCTINRLLIVIMILASHN